MIQLKVRNLVGQVMEVEIAPEQKVSSLKTKLSHMWSIPVNCQKIIRDNVELHDTDRVLSQCIDVQSDSMLTLLISLDMISRSVEFGSTSLQMAGLVDIAALGRERCSKEPRILKLVLRRLRSKKAKVRRAALDAFAEIANAGDAPSVAALKLRFNDEDASIRCKALRTYSCLCIDRDAEELCTAIRPWLKEDDSVIRCAALDALAKIITVSNPDIIDDICVQLKHRHAKVRCAALRALASVVEPGSIKVIDATSALLQDKQEAVRALAMDVLSKGAEVGNRTVIMAFIKCLECCNRSEQRNVLEFMIPVIIKDDPFILLALKARLKHHDAGVRSIALWALIHAAQRGNPEAITCVCGCFTDADHDVRDAAFHALIDFVQPGCPHARACLVSLLNHWETRVRCLALKALTLIFQKGDKDIIEILCKSLEDHNASVRIAAVDGIQLLAPRGDALTVESITKRLQKRNTGIRDSAIDALSKMFTGPDCRGDDERSIAIVSRLLAYRHAHVRLAAVLALTQIQSRCGRCDLSLISHCVEDKDQTVRQVAQNAIACAAATQSDDDIPHVYPDTVHFTTTSYHDKNEEAMIRSSLAWEAYSSHSSEFVADHSCTSSLASEEEYSIREDTDVEEWTPEVDEGMFGYDDANASDIDQ